MKPKNFTSLVIWKKSMTISDHMQQITTRFPRDADAFLTCDLRNSAMAASSAIVRAHGSRPKAYRRSLAIARGKLARMVALLEIVEMTGLASAADLAPTRSEMRELELMLTRLRALALEQAG